MKTKKKKSKKKTVMQTGDLKVNMKYFLDDIFDAIDRLIDRDNKEGSHFSSPADYVILSLLLLSEGEYPGLPAEDLHDTLIHYAKEVENKREKEK